MNKFKLAENLYRQNVYNVLVENGYQHYTCYFTEEKELIAVLKAGDNYGLQTFVESEEIAVIEFTEAGLKTIEEVLKSCSYDSICVTDLHDPASIWNSEGLRHIYSLIARDYYILGLVGD